MYLLIDANDKVQLDNESQFNRSISYDTDRRDVGIRYQNSRVGPGVRCKRSYGYEWWIYPEATKILIKIML